MIRAGILCVLGLVLTFPQDNDKDKDKDKDTDKLFPKRCRHEDGTKPKELSGRQASADYDIRWVSDVETDKEGRFTFVRLLKNYRKGNVLPAKWMKANLEFQEIDPFDCALNTFQSTKGYNEEQDTTISFGSKLQHAAKGSLHVVTDGKNGKGKEGAALKSSFSTSQIDFMFVSEFVHGKGVRFEAESRGDQPVRFRIKALDDLIQKKIAVADWKKDNDFVLLGGYGRAFGSIAVRENERVEEKQTEIEFMQPKAKDVVARGIVTIHFPEPKEKEKGK